MRHSSSACFATFGNSSEIHRPLLPLGANFHFDPSSFVPGRLAGLVVVCRELRLVVERIDVRRTAAHGQEDDAFREPRKMRRLRRERTGSASAPQPSARAPQTPASRNRRRTTCRISRRVKSGVIEPQEQESLFMAVCRSCGWFGRRSQTRPVSDQPAAVKRQAVAEVATPERLRRGPRQPRRNADGKTRSCNKTQASKECGRTKQQSTVASQDEHWRRASATCRVLHQCMMIFVNVS